MKNNATACLACLAWALSMVGVTNLTAQNQNTVLGDFKVPVYGFIENKGQILDEQNKPNETVRYQFAMNGLNVQLKRNGFSYDTYVREKNGTLSFHRVDIELVNANPAARLLPAEASEDFINYYTAAGAISDVRSFDKIVFSDVYPGIDLVFKAHALQENAIEYDFIVKPGSDASQIQLKYTGPFQTRVESGKVKLALSHGVLSETIPQSYLKETEKTIDVQYQQINDNTIAFHVPDYDRAQTLIIDPTPSDRTWGTFYGGTGADSFTDMAIDASGNTYLIGTTASTASIATGSSFQTTLGGGKDAMVVKLNSSGERQWATYIGGTSDDEGSVIGLDASLNIYVMGTTLSSGMSTDGSQLQGGTDLFFFRLNNASGTRTLSTYYGGTGNETVSAMTVSGTAIYFGGSTTSTADITYPVIPAPYLTTLTGGAYVGRFSTGGSIYWFTYFQAKNVLAMAVDNSGYLIIGGEGNASGTASAGAHQTSNNGGTSDGFLASIIPSGTLNWSTYYGGSGQDRVEEIKTNSSGIYIGGYTSSTTGIATGTSSFIGGTGDGYVAHFNTSGTRQWGLYVGGSSADQVSKLALHSDGAIFFGGYTASTDAASSGTYQTTNGGSNDVFFGKIDPYVVANYSATGNPVLWRTLYGGTSADVLNGLAVGGTSTASTIYMGGSTGSSAVMFSAGAHQSSNGGSTDGFAALFNDCGKPGKPAPITVPAGPYVIGQQYTFSVGTTYNATTYAWVLPSGWTGSSTTNSITVTVGNNSGSITVSGVNTCGGGTSTSTTSLVPSAADATPPTISTLSPVNNGINVSVSANLVATFSENISVVSAKTITVKRFSDNSTVATYSLPSGNVTASGSTLTINPTLDLAAGLKYYILMDAGAVEDATGNDFAGISTNAVWSFTTSGSADVTAPNISTFSPVDGATNISLTSNLSATFSENVLAVSSKVITLKKADNSTVESFTLPSARVTISGATVTIDPTNNLTTSTDYYVLIDAGALEDVTGNDFAGITLTTTWNFTSAAPGDVTAPTISTYSPANNATDVALASNIVLTFSENINVVSVKNVYLYRYDNSSIVEFFTLPSTGVTVSGTTATINPTNNLLNGVTYSIVIQSGAFEDAAGNDFAGIANTTIYKFTAIKADQTITFNEVLPTKTYGDESFNLNSTASSGLTVLFSSSNTAVATIQGSNLVFIGGAGTTTITANQVGNTYYNAATPVQQTLTVIKANQSITLEPLPAKTYGDGTFALPSTAESGLIIAYASSNTSVATIAGNLVSIKGAGSTTITASQAGNSNYNAAPNVQQTLTVNKADQTISFGALSAKTFGDANFALSATASSGQTVSYSSSNTAVATVSGNIITIVGGGSTIITASQTGNTNYNAATPVQQTLTVNKANQTITFNALASKTYLDAPFALTATASSGFTVSYSSSNTAVATISGSTVTIVGAGSTTITASQSGSTNYNSATPVQQTLTVNKANQTITFNALPGKTSSDPNFDLTASATSGLTISYTSSNTAVATISGNTVALVGAGSTTITASQAGNSNYNPAISVNQTLTVAASDGTPPQITSFSPANNATNVSINTSLVMTFNEPVRLAGNGATKWAILWGGTGGNSVIDLTNSSVTTISGNTITMNPGTLQGSTTYYITLADDIIDDLYGNWMPGWTGNSTWSFTTADVTAPYIVSVSPAHQSIDVPINTTFTITYSEPVTPNTAGFPFVRLYIWPNQVEQVQLDNTQLVSINGSDVTVSFTNPLQYNTNYLLATFSQMVKDAAGNVNAENPSYQFTTIKGNQTIAFNALAAKTFGDANFALSATATSGLSVSYSSSNISVATVSGNTVSIVGAGSTTITASQPGNTYYNSATSVQQTLTVNKANQTMTFNDIPVKTLGDPTFSLSATASSGLGVSFVSSNTSVATVSGSTVTIVGAGTTIITASQSGNANYNAALSVDKTLVVSDPAKQNQTITFGALAAKTFGEANFSLSATASSGLAVAFSSSNAAIASVSGTTVTIHGAGTVTITANQSGNGTFNAAPPIEQTLTINKANQTITFTALASKTFGDADFNLSATSSSGLTVNFTSSNTAVATVSGSTISIVGAGTATITAVQGGDANYNAASSVGQTLTVNKADQIITFGSLAAVMVSDPPFTLSATASSGLAVSYSSSNTAVATVSGNTVNIVGEGSTIITATQSGNTNYNSAPTVQQTLTVTNKLSQTITFAALSIKTFGDANFSLTASASSSLSVSYSSSNTAVATISGNTVTILGAGTTVITASQAGNETFNIAPEVQQTLTVNKAAQTIEFGSLAQKIEGDGAFDLSATSSSGLAVTFSSSNASVATISGNTVTLVGAGSTTITASQSGNSNFLAATAVQQMLVVNAQTRIISLSGNMAFGELIVPETATRVLTIGNSGNTTLTITNIAYPAGFNGDKTSGSVVAGGSLTVNVTLTANEAKEFSGNITVTSDATAGAATIAVSGTANLVTGLEPNLVSRLKVYPNPGVEVFTIEVYKPTEETIHVADQTGKFTTPVKLEFLEEGKYTFKMTEQPQGVYFLRIQTESGVKTARIIKL